MGNGEREVVEQLGKLVELRKDAVLFVIVHSEKGLEVLSNSNDLVMKLGMLDVAKMTVVEVHTRIQEMAEDEVRRNAEAAVAAMNVKPGRMN